MKEISKKTKQSLATYILVIAFYAVCEIWLKTGNMSSLMEGLLVPLCYYMILAVSLNIVVGISGELSLGHAGFMSVGAFSGIVAAMSFQASIPSEPVRLVIALCVGAACAECTAVITQGGFDLRAVVDFELLSAKRLEFMQLESVADTEAEEYESRPSVTVIRAAQGDTLWSLGKKYHSTPALITSLNGLEEGDALAGRVLLIPYAGK